MEQLTAFFSQYRTVILLIVLIVAVYFLMIRPQRKQQKARDEQFKAMKIGDEVMTAGGFYGIIYAIDDENMVLEMLPDYNKMLIRRQSIVKVITEKDRVEEVDEVEEVEEVAEITEAEEVAEVEEVEVAEEEKEA